MIGRRRDGRTRHERRLCSRSTSLGKRFGGFVALDGIDLSVGARRARRAHRPQRLGQEHAGQLHLRNARQRQRHGLASTASASTGSKTHERTRRGIARSFQLPRPFASLTVAENLEVPMLYTVDARPGTGLSAAELAARGADLLRAGRARRQGRATPARSHPGGDAQARARPRHGGGAAAPDRGRIHGRACRRSRSPTSWRC